jgi:hypothetical protein
VCIHTQVPRQTAVAGDDGRGIERKPHQQRLTRTP